MTHFFAVVAKLPEDFFIAYLNYAAAHLVNQGHHSFFEVYISTNHYFIPSSNHKHSNENHLSFLKDDYSAGDLVATKCSEAKL